MMKCMLMRLSDCDQDHPPLTLRPDNFTCTQHCTLLHALQAQDVLFIVCRHKRWFLLFAGNTHPLLCKLLCTNVLLYIFCWWEWRRWCWHWPMLNLTWSCFNQRPEPQHHHPSQHLLSSIFSAFLDQTWSPGPDSLHNNSVHYQKYVCSLLSIDIWWWLHYNDFLCRHQLSVLYFIFMLERFEDRKV